MAFRRIASNVCGMIKMNSGLEMPLKLHFHSADQKVLVPCLARALKYVTEMNNVDTHSYIRPTEMVIRRRWRRSMPLPDKRAKQSG